MDLLRVLGVGCKAYAHMAFIAQGLESTGFRTRLIGFDFVLAPPRPTPHPIRRLLIMHTLGLNGPGVLTCRILRSELSLTRNSSSQTQGP